MSTGIIEINDAGIRVGRDGRILSTSPGYAVLDGDRLLIGEEGHRNARLLPRWTNNRFWNQLGTEPLRGGTDNIRHNADLAYAHLEQIWSHLESEVEDVVFAVPGFYSKEQLGLLLGMARECGIPVSGIADTAVAAVSEQPLRAVVLHLDIFLHRITLTVLKADTMLRRVDTVTVSETGLFTLWDRWANIIAGQFIQTSRYDPMHQAVSEQRLYDALPGWIETLDSSRAHTFELEVGDSRHQVAVSHEQLLGACANIYPQIVQLIRDHIPAGETVSLFVSDRFQGFPGLDDSLHLIEHAEPTRLDATSAFEGIRVHREHITSGSAVSHVTTLPLSATRPAAPLRQRPRNPTHVLIGNHATGIGTALRIGGIDDGEIRPDTDSPVCTIYIRGPETMLENHGGDRVLVNDETPSSPVKLATGDRLSIDGEDLTLISVS